MRWEYSKLIGTEARVETCRESPSVAPRYRLNTFTCARENGQTIKLGMVKKTLKALDRHTLTSVVPLQQEIGQYSKSLVRPYAIADGPKSRPGAAPGLQYARTAIRIDNFSRDSKSAFSRGNELVKV
jgi:hypothetical protein